MPAHNPLLLSAAELKGDKVTNSKGESLGEIKEVMIDLSAGRIAYAVISFGGFLGLGEKMAAVPWNAIRTSTRENEFLTDLSKDELKNAPSFDKDRWPGGADRSFLTDLYSYYGYSPYWTGAPAETADLDVGANTASEAARAGIGEAAHRDRDEMAAGMGCCDTGLDRHADPAEASGVQHDAGLGDVSGGAMPRTWNTQNAGGMSDMDMDVRSPGGNVRASSGPELDRESPGQNVPIAESASDYEGSQTPRDALREALRGNEPRDDAFGASGAPGAGGSDYRPDYPFDEGGTSGGTESLADATAEGVNIDSDDATGSRGASSAIGGSRPSGPFRGSGSTYDTGGGATGYGNLGGKGPGGSDFMDTAHDPGRHRSRGGAVGGSSSSGSGDIWSDAGEMRPEGGGRAGEAEKGNPAPGDVPEGEGDTRAFALGEENPAVSGFGSSGDVVDMSGASGVSSRGMTGGSEGLSAADDLPIGSVDDLNTAGSTLGFEDEANGDEDASPSTQQGSPFGADDDELGTGAAGSGRGHSSGPSRTTRRGSSSEESEENREERRQDLGQ